MRREAPSCYVQTSLTVIFESIKVTFSIADMNEMDPDPDQMEDADNAMEDEPFDEDLPTSRPKRTINQAGTKGGSVDVMPEDSVAPADRAAQGEEEDSAIGEDQMTASYPTQLSVTISKPGKGAIQIAANAQDGLVDIVDVYYFPKLDIADPKTAEKMHAKQTVYAGPPFGNLDSDLQEMLERYIDERGINTQLAMFVPDYVDYKEQKEYVQWLESEWTPFE